MAGGARQGGLHGGQAGGNRRIIRLRRRDGSVVAYDAERVRESVRRAQTAAADPDPVFAGEVEEVVRLALFARCSGGHGASETEPGTWELDALVDLVEQALIEMGRSRVAKAFIVHRDRREQARAALRILPEEPREGKERRLPVVRDAEGAAEWNTSRITAALMREADLPREIAEQVADRVEGRVLDGGWRRLTTGFVRELVSNELAAMGFGEARARQEPVALPRHDLRRLLRAGPTPGPRADELAAAKSTDLEASLTAEVLRRYVIDDVLDERSAEAHLKGDLAIEDLGRPHVPLSRAVPIGLLLENGDEAGSAFVALERIAALLARTAHGMVLEETGSLLAVLAGRGARPGTLADWLAALGSLAAASGRSLDLAPPLVRSPAVLARTITELAALARAGRVGPRLFLTWNELEPALESCESSAVELLERGRLLPVWNGAEEHFAGPGCVRVRGERSPLACQGAAALNLVRLARRAGPWREDALMEELHTLLPTALDALERLDAFQSELRGAHVEILRERSSFALVPVGLAEALRILGDGECRPEQGGRLLGFLADAAARMAERRGLSLVLAPFFGGRARMRFAALDARTRRSAQPRLFGELPSPEAELVPAYSSGFALPASHSLAREQRDDAGEEGERRARLLAGVASGGLFPLEVGREARGRGTSLLELWRRFAAAREPLITGGARARMRSRATSPGPLFDVPNA
jgi:hypothetical protein